MIGVNNILMQYFFKCMHKKIHDEQNIGFKLHQEQYIILFKHCKSFIPGPNMEPSLHLLTAHMRQVTVFRLRSTEHNFSAIDEQFYFCYQRILLVSALQTGVILTGHLGLTCMRIEVENTLHQEDPWVCLLTSLSSPTSRRSIESVDNRTRIHPPPLKPI